MLPPPDSGEDRVWVASCHKWRWSKRPYAMDFLVWLRGNSPGPRTEVAVHHCNTCRGWHLTSLLQDEINNNAPDVRQEMKATGLDMPRFWRNR